MGRGATLDEVYDDGEDRWIHDLLRQEVEEMQVD